MVQLYMPATVLGLLGLVVGYLYFYMTSRDEWKLKVIQNTPPDERVKMVELMLSELGTSISTDGLAEKDKYRLLTKVLRAKNRKYLIVSVTSIVLTIIAALLLYSQNLQQADVKKEKIADDIIVVKDTIVQKASVIQNHYGGGDNVIIKNADR